MIKRSKYDSAWDLKLTATSLSSSSNPPIPRGYKVGNMPGRRSGLLYSFMTSPLGIARSGSFYFLGSKFLKAEAVNVQPLMCEGSGSDMPIFSSITWGSKLIFSGFNWAAGCDMKPEVSSGKY